MKNKSGKLLAGILCMCMIVTNFVSPIYANANDALGGGNDTSVEQSVDNQSAGGSGSVADSKSAANDSEGSKAANDSATKTESAVKESVSSKVKSGSAAAENEEASVSAAADTGEPGALTMENHSLKWVSGSSKTVIDGNDMTMTPDSNADVSAKAQLTYSCGGNEGVDVGKAEIRLPRYVYYDRDGNPIGTVELSIPEAPATGGATSFNWTLDDNGTPDDPSDDEIVIRNYKEIQPGGFFMKADIVWKFSPLEVSNGFSNSDLQASFKTQGNSGGAALEDTSDKLTTTVNTKVPSMNPSKSVREKKEVWNTAWGPKPADADDYYYVVWTLKQPMYTSSTTAPYTVRYEELPGAIDDEGNTNASDNNKGEVVAWANYSYYNEGKPTANGTGKETDFKLGNLEAMNNEIVATKTTKTEINSTSGSYIGRDVVMRYPKKNVENDTPVLKNGFKSIITTADGEITERVALKSYTYQHVSVGVEYPGDQFSMYKRQRAGYTNATGKIPATFAGALSKLRLGKEVEADWSIDVKNMGWTRTANGTKTYDTVLRDGMMYVGGERLLPEDYELTKFYPAQYDVFGVGYDEDKGYFLGIAANYDKAYAPIKVEVMDAAGNWSEYGSITRTGDKTFKWTGVDGTTKTGNMAIASNAIDLPAGTQDIRFTHTDKMYGVEYRMGLFYKLKPSDHLMGIIGDSTTSFNLININEAWGAQDGKIYTPGNEFDNKSTPTIKTDVEAQDTSEFGGTKVVAHDYAEHVFNAISPTASFRKTMSKPVNEIDAQRVKIPVNMTWDYYYNFTKLGVTLNEAIDLGLINEARESDFYDLLPPGVDVDLNSISVVPYSTTNVDGKRLTACDYTVEMIDNWRESGRTMMIIHAKVPADFRNFAKSTAYVDTGFVVNFNMYDSWDNIETNGIALQNDAAMYSKDGEVTGGVSDTGVGSSDKTLFENLGDEGGDKDLENNVKYSNSTTTVDVPRAAQMGFSKRVKGAADTGYASTTTIPATGDYSYQMRFALQDNAKAKSVVMYDVLETAYNNNEHWSGTFKGLDVSQIKREFPDIDLKIYYSTSSEFGNLQATSGIDYTDLTNTTLWSDTAPDDLNKVTAVAVDLSKKKDGSVMEFEGPISVSATISMTSPGNYKDYLDDPETEADETVYAYNQAFIKQGNEKPEGSETTTISLKKPDLKISKSSNPSTGTVAAPRGVVAGGTIDYTLKVSNNNLGDSVKKVKVEDVIPDGLEIDSDNLAYYFGSQSKDKMPADGTKRVSATVEGQKVTFIIDKLASKEIASLVIPVKVKEDVAGGTKFDNKAEITEFNDEEWDDYESEETHHKVASASLMLPLRKVVTGAARPSKKTFTFEITGEDGAPMPSSGNTVTTKDAANVYFSSIKFNKPGEYKYTIKEKNSGETGYTYDSTVHHVTVVVKDTGGTSLKATWTDAEMKAEDNGKITFTNNYAPIPVDFAIPVEKLMGGDPIPDNHKEDFEFTLSPGAAANPMPADGKTRITITGLDSAENMDKTKSYDKMTFTEPGTYVYQIKETIGNTPGYKYAYDISTHTVTLKVTDNDGQLVCTWTDKGDSGTVLFKNDYEPTADIISFDVKKAVTGNPRVDKFKKSFKFNLSEPEYDGEYDYAAANEALPMPNATTTTIVDNGTAEIGQIAIKHAGRYIYTISEENSGAAGYTYDTNVCKVIVDAVDTGGEIEADITYQFVDKDGNNVDATQFKNTYKPAETSTVLTVNKEIDGDTPADNQKTFVFKVTPKSGAPMPESGNDIISITGEGSGTLDAIKYTEAGTYEYEVTETGGNEKGYTYSMEKYTVTVDVADNDGVLEATQTITKGGGEAEAMDFTNTYAPEATSFTPHVVKTITGNARPDDQKRQFAFTLEGIGDAPVPAGDGCTATVVDEGESDFGKIFFTKAGTYKYRITEIAGNAEGYTYSNKVRNLTVKVSDNNGKLVAVAEGDAAEAAEFTNAYRPAPVSHQVKVSKKIIGNARPAGNAKTFTFIMTPVDGAPMADNAKTDEDGGKYDECQIQDEGTSAFDEITYTEAGTYKYTVEEQDGYENGYSYSMVKYDVTVAVTDSYGILKKSVTYTNKDTNESVTITDTPDIDISAPKVDIEVGDGDGDATENPDDKQDQVTDDASVEFENEYRPETTSVTLSVEKTITGNARPEDNKKDFEFTLTGEDENTPMPKAGGETATVTDEGTGEFGKIIYEKAGTYKYTVAEEKGDANSYTYSEDVYDVTVVVTDNDGTLEHTVTYEKDGEPVEDENMSFENQYNLAPVTFRLPVEKSVSGDKPAKPENFQFRIEPVGDVPMPDEDTVSITGEGTVEFGEMTFTDAGAYKYSVYEVKGDAKGYTYDSKVFDVIVTVTDDDGTLVADWTCDGEKVDAVKFVNRYTEEKVKDDKKDKENSGTGSGDSGNGPDTGDDNNLALMLVLMLTSAAGAIFVRRKFLR